MPVRALGLVLVVPRPVCTQHIDPMAGRPLDPDKPVCITSCWGVEADPFFVDFCPQPTDFCSRPYIYTES